MEIIKTKFSEKFWNTQNVQPLKFTSKCKIKCIIYITLTTDAIIVARGLYWIATAISLTLILEWATFAPKAKTCLLLHLNNKNNTGAASGPPLFFERSGSGSAALFWKWEREREHRSIFRPGGGAEAPLLWGGAVPTSDDTWHQLILPFNSAQ